MTEAEKQFIGFTEPYRVYGDKIRLKIDHTLRVAGLCRDLAASLNLNAEDAKLAEVCGLLHDIGRFEQWRKYQTYNDSRSVDHGDLGAEFLQEQGGRICAFAEEDFGTVLHTVRFHNKYCVPETLSGRDRQFADIVRDADKLDILYSFAEGELVSRIRDTAISTPVFRAVLEGRGIHNTELTTKADELAFRLAFVFDFHFERSFGILQETGAIERMICRYRGETGNEELKAQLDALGEHIRSYLEGKTKA